VTTEQQEQDYAAVAWMIRQGSSAWTGPTPHAEQARWATKAAKAARRPAGFLPTSGLRGLVFTALVFFTVLAVAAAMTPGGLMSVPKTVSDAFSQKAPRGSFGPASVSPSDSPEPSQDPQPALVSPPVQTGGVAHGTTPSPGPRPSAGGVRPSVSPSPRPTDE
jgi:hypothetical protein